MKPWVDFPVCWPRGGAPSRGVLGLLCAAFVTAASAAPVWRPLDPETTLIIDTSKGRIVVSMRPELAPEAVARVKLLSREGVYDGLLFHRVIDHFVDQTGNPNNHDGGVSRYPNLPAEFTATLDVKAIEARSARKSDGVEGFIGFNPVAAISSPDARTVRAWGLYCAGVVGMGRQADASTANSEIFFMRDAGRRLDHDYAVWGRVVEGLDVVRAINVGEPPAAPDKMIRVRVMVDLAPADRPRLEAMDVRSPDFARLIARARRDKGADFTPCDIAIPTRKAPQP
jgi:peptidylprolyl isomerase